MNRTQAAFPDGHFYSPIVNVDEVGKEQEAIWPSSPVVLGIDFNEPSQRSFLVHDFPAYYPDYDYPDEATADDGYSFYTNNGQFGWLDSRALFVMLRKLRPSAMIEVGSGYSSLLTADVNRRFLNNSMHFTCIEPYPRPFLSAGVPGISRLIPKRVQEVPPSTFESLRSGDVLFIDSSHVSKTGSDVNYLVFEILPRLSPGVVIHVHDIFLPFDYPSEWVLKGGRSWNEQYLIRALLMYTEAFEVLFGSMFACRRFPDQLRQALGGDCYGGGSLWLRKSVASESTNRTD